jgi:gliding-associated putative ABC transporter substrate-binding component GldG
MKKLWDSKFWWLALLLILAAINFLASAYHSSLDLTKEKRFTLSSSTKQILGNLNEQVHVEVYLKGDFPANFRKLTNAVDEFLEDCKDYSRGKITVNFIDPFKIAKDSADQFLKLTLSQIQQDSIQILRDTSRSFKSLLRIQILRNQDKPNLEKNVTDIYSSYFIDSISSVSGITPFTLQSPGKVGDEQVTKSVLPGAVIHYADTSIGVDLFKGQRRLGSDPEQLAAYYNNVEATLEFKFISAIQKASSEKFTVAYLLGNGEAFGYNINDAFRTLRREYFSDTFNLKLFPFIPREFQAIVIVKPTIPFTDEDKMKLDQYVMNGGKIFWMIDNMTAEFDSLYKPEGFIAFDRQLNLEDILFRYGVRLNENLLQDMQCDKLGQLGSDQQAKLVDWPFFPILNGTDNPISKNLDGVRAMFPNTLDTVKAAGIRKTFLLRSSPNARVMQAPAKITYEFLQIAPDIREFNVHDTTVAVLLEGKFNSLYAGRIPKEFSDRMAGYNMSVKTVCDQPTKMIVVADGDIAVNQVSPEYGPMPMGYNFYTKYSFANKEFFTNCLEYLVNPSNILETRSKEFTLRLLDPKKVQEEKSTWQFLNIGLPILVVILFGFAYQQIRKRRFAA